MKNNLKKSVTVLIDALRQDKSDGSYYYSWQSNIAMAFHDEFMKMVNNGEIEVKFKHSFTFHDCCNNSAKAFLDNLIGYDPEPIDYYPQDHVEPDYDIK